MLHTLRQRLVTAWAVLQAGGAPAWWGSPAATKHQNFSSFTGAAARILDGKAVAVKWQEELALEVADLTTALRRAPCLGVVVVGSRPDSMLYVTRKREACGKAGVQVVVQHLPASVTQAQLEGEMARLAGDVRVDGVLIQLPLPPHLCEERIMEHIDPRKDVDGFHPLNMGRMLMRGRVPRLVPCTPLGCMELLRRSGLDVAGKSAVVLGDSNIVGTPLAALLRDEGAAAVTVCHQPSLLQLYELEEQRAAADACLPRLPGPAAPASCVPNGPDPALASPPTNLPTITTSADLLVVAVGVPQLVKASWVKPGAVVVDVGINVLPPTAPATSTPAGQSPAPAFSPGSYHVVGDVDFASVSQVAGAITPVPGGVGPMTIAGVLHNTLRAARYHCGLLPW